MAWTNAGVIHPSRNWQYTNVVEGEFFRLSHNYSDLPTEYFQSELTQIEESEDGAITTFGYQVIEASPTSEVIRLTKPECFSNRKIAIRQLSRDVDLPPAGRVYSWAIGIERFDPIPDVGGGETPRTTGFSTNQATLRGAEGLTLISSTIIDDNNIMLPDIGFNFPYFGNNYRTGIKVNSNSFFQMATSVTSANAAPEFLNGVSLGSSDGNVNKLYGLASANAYLIRFEGHSSYTQQTINKVWETTLFSDGVIQLAFGVWESSTVGFVSNGTNPATKADWTIAANSSYVIDFIDGLPRVRSGSYTL